MVVENNWSILVDEDFLDEVNYLVEYLIVFYGLFEFEFLFIFEEVFVMIMKEY